MKEWRRVDPTTVKQVGWRTIIEKTFVLPNGQTASFDTVGKEGQAFAAMIALTAEKEVIIARQFRPGPEMVLDEIPGGAVEEGEEIEAAGRRELLEETGYKPGQIQYLGSYHKDAYLNGIWHVFLATDCVRVKEQALDDSEAIEVVLISIDQLIKNGQGDRMTDAAPVLMAYDILKSLA